jgi:hypothetical protein
LVIGLNIAPGRVPDMDDAAFENSQSFYESLSLYANQHTARAAKISCGCTIEAGLAVARGEVRNAFAIVRPPGHHAEPDQHMGFCFFNNVAVAARVIQAETSIKKILILDWYVMPERTMPAPLICLVDSRDVHHGKFAFFRYIRVVMTHGPDRQWNTARVQ